MSTTQDLVTALKAELKAAGITYADLAQQLGMAESSIKRIFAKADMPLSRIDEVLRKQAILKAELGRERVGIDRAELHDGVAGPTLDASRTRDDSGGIDHTKLRETIRTGTSGIVQVVAHITGKMSKFGGFWDCGRVSAETGPAPGGGRAGAPSRPARPASCGGCPNRGTGRSPGGDDRRERACRG